MYIAIPVVVTMIFNNRSMSTKNMIMMFLGRQKENTTVTSKANAKAHA